MLKKLEQQALLADLASVEALLTKRSEETDPIGWFQFNARKARLETELASLSAQPASINSIAMLFGGRPVVGSHGIVADFGAKIIQHMQALVSIQSASLDGALGERGPIPQREQSQVLLTDVARGSFGFVLEDSGQPLGEAQSVMQDVCILLGRLGSSETESFDVAAEGVEERMLPTLRGFFRTLDENGATLRLLTDAQEIDLDREAVSRAKQRTEQLEISEPRIMEVSGRIFTMPEAKRFELHPVGGAATIKGGIAVEFIREMFDNDYVASRDFNGQIRSVKLRVKETRVRREMVRYSYTLLAVSEV